MLVFTLIGASCDPIDPDAEQVTATLSNCVVEEIDAISGIETCTIRGDDPRLEGSWEFSFLVREEGEGLLYEGGVLIRTTDGMWEGTMERIVLDSGPWKGGGMLSGLGGHEGYALSLEGQQDLLGTTYPLTGAITPTES